MNLKDKIIIVTGAAGAIGEAVAQKCLEYGAKVVAVDLREKELNEVAYKLSANGGVVFPICTDITDRNAVKAMVAKAMEKFGRIDCLFNNAGMNRKNLVNDVLDEDYEAIMNVNVRGVFIVASEVSKVMIPAGKGRIVNTASIASIEGEYANSVYCMSKAAVSMMTKIMAMEWAEHGISVVAVGPGKVRTPMLHRGLVKLAETHGVTVEEMYKRTEAAIPAKRLLETEEIGELVAYLFDDKASYIMGNTVLISGGIVM